MPACVYANASGMYGRQRRDGCVTNRRIREGESGADFCAIDFCNALIYNDDKYQCNESGEVKSMRKQGEGLRFTANVGGQGRQFAFYAGDTCAAECRFEHGLIEFSILYDFSVQPLVLRGNAGEGDTLAVIILPQRIELWVNGRLLDEEWPCGSHSLARARLEGAVPCRVEPYAERAEPLPAVLGEFVCAEGWQPGPNVFVGDCMPYSDGGRYHVLYLKDRHHHRSKWGLGAHQWEHISTSDFHSWRIHPMAVAIESPDEGSICTGSWLRRGDTHYLFYTIRTCDGSPARIARSVSMDGYHFRRDADFAVYLSERYTGVSARDPKVILDERGTYHMFLTTTLRAEQRGCLAHLTSADADTWREEDAPLYIAPGADEPECCDYVHFRGWYYLVFSLRGQGRYLYSSTPFGDWQAPRDPAIPCKSVPKAAVWEDRLIFTGFDGHGKYAGTMTFLEATAGETGELRYEPVAEHVEI